MANAAPIPLERDRERARETIQEREPVHELAPDSLIIVCESCESYWSFDPETSGLALGGFREDHEDHLGHRPDDTVVASEFFDEEELTAIEWIVECNDCTDQWRFSSEDAAEDFIYVHEIHTGHEPAHARKSYREDDQHEAPHE